MPLLRSLASCCLAFFIGGYLASRVRAQAQDERELESLYIVTHVVSDASPFWFEYVLHIKPQGKDVLVREIRIAPLSSACTNRATVKAADHLVKHAALQRVVGLDLCSLEVGAVSAIVSRAQSKGVVSVDDTASFTIVASCGKTNRVFEIPYPETLNLEELKKMNPQVGSLWDLAHEIQRRSFGEKFSFYDNSASQDKAFQALGAEIFPAIKSGIYDPGFPDRSHLEFLMDEYSGPVNEVDPWRVEFAGPAPAELSQYQLPMYPAIAKQARIQGEVRLALVLDTHTGLVKDVKVTSGNRLLADHAVAAVRGWHFQNGNPNKDSAEVALRFVLRCPFP
jgi:TonB family protein